MAIHQHHSREPDVSPDEVQHQLVTVCASRAFMSSPRLSTFLRYIVERALDGTADDVGVLDLELTCSIGATPLIRVPTQSCESTRGVSARNSPSTTPLMVTRTRLSSRYQRAVMSRCSGVGQRWTNPLRIAIQLNDMVGREREIAALETGLQQVSAGQSLLVSVTGEAE